MLQPLFYSSCLATYFIDDFSDAFRAQHSIGNYKNMIHGGKSKLFPCWMQKNFWESFSISKIKDQSQKRMGMHTSCARKSLGWQRDVLLRTLDASNQPMFKTLDLQWICCTNGLQDTMLLLPPKTQPFYFTYESWHHFNEIPAPLSAVFQTYLTKPAIMCVWNRQRLQMPSCWYL